MLNKTGTAVSACFLSSVAPPRSQRLSHNRELCVEFCEDLLNIILARSYSPSPSSSLGQSRPLGFMYDGAHRITSVGISLTLLLSYPWWVLCELRCGDVQLTGARNRSYRPPRQESAFGACTCLFQEIQKLWPRYILYPLLTPRYLQEVFNILASCSMPEPFFTSLHYGRSNSLLASSLSD
jgi:hypothetical protein